MSEMGVAPVILHILDHFSGIFPYKASILRGTPIDGNPHQLSVLVDGKCVENVCVASSLLMGASFQLSDECSCSITSHFFLVILQYIIKCGIMW